MVDGECVNALWITPHVDGAAGSVRTLACVGQSHHESHPASRVVQQVSMAGSGVDRHARVTHDGRLEESTVGHQNARTDTKRYSERRPNNL